MKTFVAIVMLVVFGVMATIGCVFVLNLAGFPGALVAGSPGRRSKGRLIFGSVVSALGQSYVYLAFAAFVVNWTMLAARRGDVSGWLLWPISFLVVVVPMWVTLIRARVEAQELPHASAQVEALHLTMLVALLGFFLFVFMPKAMRLGWAWVPYMSD